MERSSKESGVVGLFYSQHQLPVRWIPVGRRRERAVWTSGTPPQSPSLKHGEYEWEKGGEKEKKSERKTYRQLCILYNMFAPAINS